MKPWQEETLTNLNRVIKKGINRGIDTKNSELLDTCSHLKNLLDQTKLLENTDKQMEKYMDYSSSLPTEYIYPDPKEFFDTNGKPYLIGNQQVAARAYTTIRVLEFLNGRPWDDIALAYVHALRPSMIRVTCGETTLNVILWRVTVFTDQNNIIKYIEQEVEVALPERIEHGQHLREELDRC